MGHAVVVQSDQREGADHRARAEGQLARRPAEEGLGLQGDRRSGAAQARVAAARELVERRAGAAALHVLLVHLSSSTVVRAFMFTPGGRAPACGAGRRPAGTATAS